MQKSRNLFYFCFKSPYSWIAARWLEEKYPSVIDQIEYVPFWEPDEYILKLLRSKNGRFLYTPMSREKHLYILQDIKRIIDKLGYSIKWPIDEKPWWELPHLAYIAACQFGKGKEFFKAVYKARWEKGKNICSEEVIEQIAIDLSLDPEEIIIAPNRKTIRQKGVEALYKSYRNGVFGIPFFICEKEKFWGLDRFGDFISALYAVQDDDTKISNKNTDLILKDEQIIEYDNDHAGGCG